MRIPPKYLRIGGIVLLSLLVLLTIGGIIGYSKREALLKSAIEKAIRKAKSDYNLNVKIGQARFTGMSSVELQGITVVPENRDSLANIRRLSVRVKLFPLLAGDVKLAEVGMNNGKVTLTKKDTIRNYDFLFRKKGEKTKSDKKVDLSALANNLMNQVLYKIPENMDIKDFEISFTEDTNSVSLYTTTATIIDGYARSNIKVNNTESVWHVEGKVEPDDKQLDLKLYAEGKKVELPFLKKRYGLKLNFDTIRTELKSARRTGGRFVIEGSWAIKNLLLNHARIANNDIILPSGSIDAKMLVGENYVA
ncbi:MAG TPA: penicillin-binding protein, partial [Sphingobacteriaceae bacterium]